MATPYAAVSRDLRSGGKMVRARRPRLTPYDRPPAPADATPDSGNPDHTPGWLSRLVLSPTRLIATGAGKVLASVFGSDSASESSSDSEDSGSEDIDDVNGEDYHDLTPDVGECADQNQASQETNSLIKDSQVFEWRSETKRLIAQLLMEETFSREESDRLTQIIESRVADRPITEVVGSDVGVSDLRDTAVIEAKRWLERKKSGSDSKSDFDYGVCRLNTFVLPNVDECEMGSPVDLAKSYMQARPPWSSPTANHISHSSPNLNVLQQSKEDSPYSFSGNTSKLHKESPLSGSWSILEELRKVRSRATEDMLKTRPSSKIDWSPLGLNFKRSSGFNTGDQVEAAVSSIAFDGSHNALILSPDTSVPGATQDVEVRANYEGRGGLSTEPRLQSSEAVMSVSESDAVNAGAAIGRKDDTDDNLPLNAATDQTGQDSRFHEMNGSVPSEASDRGADVATNGFPSGSSLSAEERRKEQSRPSEENGNGVSLDHELKTSLAEEETCNFLSEYLLDVPVMDLNNDQASMSQNSFSTLQEEILSEDKPQPKSKRGLSGRVSEVEENQRGLSGRVSDVEENQRGLSGRVSDVEENQRGKKVSRYNRRGRGRGK